MLEICLLPRQPLKTGGRGRIRTSVARKERQIYSLLVLATHPPVPQNHSGRWLVPPAKHLSRPQRAPVKCSGHNFSRPRFVQIFTGLQYSPDYSTGHSANAEKARV